MEKRFFGSFSRAFRTSFSNSTGSAALIVRSGTGFLMAMFSVNVGLCVFNFLPIPPLDGSRLLPRSFDDIVEQAGKYSFLLVLVVLNVAPLRNALIVAPVRFLGNGILAIFGHPRLM